MLKRTAVFSLAILGASAVMAQAYRWTDADGTTHYSDRPTAGAEEIFLPQSTRASRPVNPRTTANRVEPEAAPTTVFSYESIEIRAPAPEETLWNIEGVLNVSLNVQPELQPGHRVRVYFDGEPTMVTSSNFQIQEVYRGVHNIQAEVLDESGQLMGRSQPNRFYVQQNSIIKNNN